MIQPAWYNSEKTILYAKFPDIWTWEDAYELVAAFSKMQDTVTHGVHIIYDLSESHMVPSFFMPNVRRLINTEHPNDRLNIFITRSMLMQTLFENIVRLYNVRNVPLHYVFVGTLDQALQRIADYKEPNTGE